METKDNEIAYKPKMRVQLLDESGRLLSDRLVDQSIEFMNGPKVKHDGPLRIEVSLLSKQDIQNLTTYLASIRDGLPNREVGKQGRKPNAATELASPREEIYDEVINLIEADSNQDDIIKYLRTLGFVFMLTEDFLWYFPGFPFKLRDIGDRNSSGQYLSSFSWMVRRIKMGKDPKTDKYDPQIIFGFQMISERTAKFVCYLYKERKKPLSADLPKSKGISFSNTEMTKFPKYMTEEERLKFSTETRQLLVNQEKKPSKFYIRWFPDITFPKDLLPKLQEAITRK